MSIVTAVSPQEFAINLATYDVDPLVTAFLAGNVVVSPTSIVITTATIETITFTGNFTFTGNDSIPTDGVVTGYRDRTLEITNLNITYNEVVDAIEEAGANENNFLGFIFDQADTITGSLLADTLFGYAGNDIITGDAGNDEIAGATGIDILRGGQGRDTLRGGQGRDTINGGQGADSIVGGIGGDLLTGGLGLDILTGGDGPDTFVLIGPNTGLDTILDFAPAEDIIQVVASAFGGGLVAGPLPPGRFVTGTAAGDAGDRFIYNPTTGALLFDVDGTGATAAIQVARLSNQPALTASNIVVV